MVRAPLGAQATGALVAAGVSVLDAAACGAGSDVEAARPAGFEATQEYLAAAAADLDAVPHRVEMSMRRASSSIAMSPVRTADR
jgi:hypothetical protein